MIRALHTISVCAALSAIRTVGRCRPAGTHARTDTRAHFRTNPGRSDPHLWFKSNYLDTGEAESYLERTLDHHDSDQFSAAGIETDDTTNAYSKFITVDELAIGRFELQILSSAQQRANASLGSSAMVIGRPITSWLAPAAIASAEPITRA